MNDWSVKRCWKWEEVKYIFKCGGKSNAKLVLCLNHKPQVTTAKLKNSNSWQSHTMTRACIPSFLVLWQGITIKFAVSLRGSILLTESWQYAYNTLQHLWKILYKSLHLSNTTYWWEVCPKATHLLYTIFSLWIQPPWWMLRVCYVHRLLNNK